MYQLRHEETLFLTEQNRPALLDKVTRTAVIKIPPHLKAALKHMHLPLCRYAAVTFLPLVRFPPENTNYSASYVVIKKAILFMRAKTQNHLLSRISALYTEKYNFKPAKKELMPLHKCTGSQ
jgi:hypothetical protein